MSSIGSSLVPKIAGYSVEQLYSMFGAATQITRSGDYQAVSPDLQEEIAATKPTQKQMISAIETSWVLDPRNKNDYQLIMSANEKSLTYFQVYPELLEKNDRLSDVIINNCYDLPLNYNNIAPSLGNNSFSNENNCLGKYSFDLSNSYYYPKRNVMDVSELEQMNDLKYKILLNYLFRNDWKMQQSDFRRALNTAFYSADHSNYVIYTGIENILYIPMMQNQDIMERTISDFENHIQNRWKIPYARRIHFNMNQRALDFHTQLKVTEAALFATQSQTTANFVQPVKEQEVVQQEPPEPEVPPVVTEPVATDVAQDEKASSENNTGAEQEKEEVEATAPIIQKVEKKPKTVKAESTDKPKTEKKISVKGPSQDNQAPTDTPPSDPEPEIIADPVNKGVPVVNKAATPPESKAVTDKPIPGPVQELQETVAVEEVQTAPVQPVLATTEDGKSIIPEDIIGYYANLRESYNHLKRDIAPRPPLGTAEFDDKFTGECENAQDLYPRFYEKPTDLLVREKNPGDLHLLSAVEKANLITLFEDKRLFVGDNKPVRGFELKAAQEKAMKHYFRVKL